MTLVPLLVLLVLFCGLLALVVKMKSPGARGRASGGSDILGSDDSSGNHSAYVSPYRGWDGKF
ncbi:hypothetical protein AQ490_26820 [Wenjunlia vitaminophila]|uniref:Uncharacterized protein n=1 Tax=Wenjunlia vitaminophila TaxID=76728 RepID=A0A0T6LPN5_WENVI|nr:hypothetical protein [Wenjunlia vitaminophila]KRV48075.1 hypothetical protein AQ490_26820 [Wenjunlia vitaminophila]